ncbi:MAG: hypothetical protein C0418_00315 [Coriobacteriaceae bacterium]|nr:hypothetical protein [Coriobacteriaceae bacterium]
MPAAPPPPPAAPQPAAPNSNVGLVALLCWIFAPWGIIALFLDDYKGVRLVRSAAIQGAAVAVIGILLSSFTFGLASIAAFIYQIILGLKAYKGEDSQVPGLYGLVQSMIDQ